MSPPQVSMLQRSLRYPDGSLHYEVTASVTSRGTILPFIELFVLTITDPDNPRSDVLARVADPRDLRVDSDGVYVKVDSADLRTISSDKFARIANVDELTTVPRDRVTAVRRGFSTYLASTVSIVYDKLSTADAASRQLLDRLSKLTTDYATFYGTFRTDPATVYSLPVTSRSVEAVLTAAYVAKRSARVAAESAATAARTARDNCRSQDSLLQQRIDGLIADVALLEAARVVVNSLTETGSTNAKTFALNGADAQSYESMLVNKRSALAAARTELGIHSASCNALAQALTDADAALATARTAENDALRDAYASCPTFNPNAV